MSKVRWGVLSTSKFAQTKVIPALLKSNLVEVVAIASRDLARSREAASKFGIARAYGAYDELLRDADVQVVYNPMPNHLHVPWSIKALEAGKHVLCEKPIGLTSGEAEQLAAASKRFPDLKIMEAFMYRLHPQWVCAKEIVQSGDIGELRTIHSFFSYFNTDPNNVRNQAGIGGGGLMDIGCYNISLSRFLFDEEPKRILGIVEYDPNFKTDRLASGILDFGRGTATFSCSTQLTPYQRVNVYGAEGRVEIEIPFNAPPDRPTRLWRQQGEKIEEVVFDVCDQYTIEGDVFSRAVLDNTPVPTPIDDAVANMKAIEAVFESGRTGGWIKV